jgi:hypothetical protein
MVLSVPGSDVVAGTGDRVAVIESVTDERRFEVDPRDPSTPSIKEGQAYALDADGRKRVIARKRNGYGMALGDILLEGGDTVESLTRDLVARGLAERGYRVLAAGETAPADALHVKVGTEEFWGWFSPGFWSVSMEAKMRIRIEPRGGTPFTVSAYGINRGQSGREANWRLAYDRAFEDYLVKQQQAFAQHGL